jgi:ABC-2 type transport system ATP-binding protein
MDSILRFEKVLKAYENTIAVDHVSFEIPKASIFGMLGPNGAGKTSLIRIITSITHADSGNIWLDDQKLRLSHSAEIGYMPEERGLYKKMKVGEQLTYLARLKGLSASDTRTELKRWFEKFEIQSWWDKKVDELSKGMQQKVQFIATVLHKPKLLILDEPFSGLDPINTNLIKDEIRQLNKQGTSIIFSTHRMEQVEEMCQFIVLINKGRNVLDGKVKDIKQQFKENKYRIEFDGTLPEGLEAADHSDASFNIVSRNEKSLIVQVTEGADSNHLLKYLLDHGVRITSFNEILPTINEIFIKQVAATN